MSAKLRLCAASAVLLVARPALADSVDQIGKRLGAYDNEVTNLAKGIHRPSEIGAAPGRGRDVPTRRSIDAQVNFGIGNYDEAAIVLYDVVERYPNHKVYDEALYYLSESLFMKGDYVASRSYFTKLVVDRGTRSKYYQQSLERLIELTLKLNDSENVERWLALLDAVPAAERRSSVPYVRGKYYFFNGNYDKALQQFGMVGPRSKYYFQARYFVGASHVAKKDLARAVVEYQKLVRRPARSPDQRKVIELAQMALGRIHYERNQPSKAIDRYLEVSRRSELFDETMFEVAWVYVKNREFDKALRALELLALSDPMSPRLPNVKILEGNLRIRKAQRLTDSNNARAASDEYDRAVFVFQSLRSVFEKPRQELDKAIADKRDPADYMAQITGRHAETFDIKATLPEVAASWLRDEPEVGRIVSVETDLGQVEGDVEVAEKTIRRLEYALATPSRVNIFPGLASKRIRATEIMDDLTGMRIDLAAQQQKLLARYAQGGDSADLERLARERSELARQLRRMPDATVAESARITRARGRTVAVDKESAETSTVIGRAEAQLVAMEKFLADQGYKEVKAGDLAELKAEIAKNRAEIRDPQEGARGGQGRHHRGPRPRRHRRRRRHAAGRAARAAARRARRRAQGHARAGRARRGQRPPRRRPHGRHGAARRSHQRAAGPGKRQDRRHRQRGACRGARHARGRAGQALLLQAGVRQLRRRVARPGRRGARPGLHRGGPQAVRGHDALGCRRGQRGLVGQGRLRPHAAPSQPRSVARGPHPRHRVRRRGQRGARVSRARAQQAGAPARKAGPAAGTGSAAAARGAGQHRQQGRRREDPGGFPMSGSISTDMSRLRRVLAAALLASPLLWNGPAQAQPPAAAPGKKPAAQPLDPKPPTANPVGPRSPGEPAPQLTPPKQAPEEGPGGRRYSKDEKAVLKEIEADLKRYQRAAESHHERIKDYLYAQYLDRKARLEKRYADGIARTEAQQRKRHLDAIALLQKFINDYPNHPQFTPDAMFRLADLYLDEANWEFEKRFDEAVNAGAGTANLAADDAAQRADYSKSIALWTDVIRRFPDYRQRAGAMYLLAYYLKETGEDRRSLAVYRGLVCGNKYAPLAEPPPAPNRDKVRLSTANSQKSSFRNPYADCVASTRDKQLVEDAWVRGIGDIHFLTPGELNEAIVAYEKVARLKKSRYYDEALYKLAWSYYRNDDFLKAIAAFDESVAYSDALVKQGKEPLPLRPEALQYIAIAFTDPWSLEEQPDPVRALDRAMQFYRDRFNEPHVRDVFEQLGDTFRVLEANDQAIAAWRVAIDKYPLYELNPLVHQKIVLAYEAKGDSSAADAEAGKLASAYSPGTAWYTANETNREAMDAQQRIRERMLRAAAENIHKEAQEARAAWSAQPTQQAHDRYVELYARAAEMYQRFIDEYPTSANVYEFTYRLGETSFFAEQYMAAIPHYKWVRDHRDLSEARFEKSARSIIQAYQAEIDRQVKAGQIKEPPEPTIEMLKAMPRPIRPLDIPPLYRELQNALDEYQQIINDPSTAPNMGLLAGIVSYRFLHLEDAAKRFEFTFDKFCGTPEAVKAKDGLLAIYEIQGKDDKFAETNERFISKKCGTEEDIQLAKAQNRSKEFREAEDLFKAQKFDLAAVAFYRYTKQAIPGDPNIPVALYNSAVAYDKSGKPKTAVYLYKDFTDNPAPEFRQSEYYLAALYNTAASNYKAFDYKSAVDGYLNVVKVSNEPNRKVPPTFELSLEELRLTALFNAAVIRELDRVYVNPSGVPGTGAVSLYRKYASMEKDRRKADRATWAIARIWSTAGDDKKLAFAYDDWRKKYGRDSGNADDYVFSYYNMAKVYEKKGKKKDMEYAKRQTVKAWSTVGQPKGTAASDMAAEFDFEQVEAYYAKNFANYKIASAPRTKREADRVLDKLDRLSQDTRTRYLALGKYESGPWGLAALERVGDTLYFQALKIAEIPIPKEIIKMDTKFPDRGIQAQYMEVLQGLVKPLEDQAKTQWTKVVETGKAQGIANQWTQLAQERLHDFISQEEFPVQRAPLAEGTEKP